MITKYELFNQWGPVENHSSTQRSAYLATNPGLYLNANQITVAKELFDCLSDYKIPNRALELIQAITFATWLNSCKK